MSRIGGFERLFKEEVEYAEFKVLLLKDTPVGESPIEHLLYVALVLAADRRGTLIHDIMKVSAEYSLEEAREGTRIFGVPATTAFIEPQAQLPGWRVDFLLHYPDIPAGRNEAGDYPLQRLIVECDGHAFHERTPQQAARDRARDRQSQHDGVPVLRFTGSAIWNDPLTCAVEVLHFMSR